MSICGILNNADLNLTLIATWKHCLIMCYAVSLISRLLMVSYHLLMITTQCLLSTRPTHCWLVSQSNLHNAIYLIFYSIFYLIFYLMFFNIFLNISFNILFNALFNISALTRPIGQTRSQASRSWMVWMCTASDSIFTVTQLSAFHHQTFVNDIVEIELTF